MIGVVKFCVRFLMHGLFVLSVAAAVAVLMLGIAMAARDMWLAPPEKYKEVVQGIVAMVLAVSFLVGVGSLLFGLWDWAKDVSE